jgi:hypothetical protein
MSIDTGVPCTALLIIDAHPALDELLLFFAFSRLYSLCTSTRRSFYRDGGVTDRQEAI